MKICQYIKIEKRAVFCILYIPQLCNVGTLYSECIVKTRLENKKNIFSNVMYCTNYVKRKQ